MASRLKAGNEWFLEEDRLRHQLACLPLAGHRRRHRRQEPAHRHRRRHQELVRRHRRHHQELVRRHRLRLQEVNLPVAHRWPPERHRPQRRRCLPETGCRPAPLSATRMSTGVTQQLSIESTASGPGTACSRRFGVALCCSEQASSKP